MREVVRAAGGVVRRPADGGAQVLLVHRPRYDDWSLPKGKLHEGESFHEAAVREVLEETGLECRVGAELPAVRYVDQRGSDKLVRYWAMEAPDGRDPRPSSEVDETRWFSVAEAREALTHDRDREVLDAVLAGDAPAFLVRHAKAGDRRTWSGDDRSRPLSKSGRRQAKALVRVLSGRGVGRILSSPALRCMDSVRPLAKARGLPVEPREELLEGAPLAGMLALLDEMVTIPAVLCAHGDLIPAVVEHVEGRGTLVGIERGWKKASVWVLEREAGVVSRATYVPPPDPGPKQATRDRRASPTHRRPKKAEGERSCLDRPRTNPP